MEKYNFYYDEIYHDGSITVKNNKLNILNYDNDFKDYIGLYLGFKEKDIPKLEQELIDLENKWKLKFVKPNEELKSTVFKKFGSTKTYGLVGATQDDLGFYIELINILLKYNVKIQLNSICKMELFVRNLIPEKELSKCKYMQKEFFNNFYFSFAKFLKNYYTNEILEAIELQNYNQFKLKCINRLEEIIQQCEGIDFKKRQIDTFKWIKKIISDKNINFNVQNATHFIYNFIFIGLTDFLKENNISCSNTNVFIDNQEDTYKTLVQYNEIYKFNSINKFDSVTDPLIRATDWLVGDRKSVV